MRSWERNGDITLQEGDLLYGIVGTSKLGYDLLV